MVTAYTYDGSGLLKTATVTGDTTTDMDGTTSTVTNTTTFNYDVAGARDSVINPNFGTVSFTHTALGELHTTGNWNCSEGAGFLHLQVC